MSVLSYQSEQENFDLTAEILEFRRSVICASNPEKTMQEFFLAASFGYFCFSSLSEIKKDCVKVLTFNESGSSNYSKLATPDKIKLFVRLTFHGAIALSTAVFCGVYVDEQLFCSSLVSQRIFD